MQAQTSQFLTLLGTDRAQFVIPIFQRPYSWTLRQCDDLWDDIVAAGRFGRNHFIGSFLYVDSDAPATQTKKLMLIDGQQRMTTLSLILMALFEWMGEDPSRGGILSDMKLEDMGRSYLYRGSGYPGESAYRLLLAADDHDTLKAIVSASPLPPDPSERLVANFEHFRSKVREDGFDAEELWEGLGRLQIVDVSLKLGDDDPQLIFESMNSKGLPLTPIDLIRNFMLMRKSADEQERLYDFYWRKVEHAIGADNLGDFNLFIWYFLSLRSPYATPEGAVYEGFKHYWDAVGAEDDVEGLLGDLVRYAGFYANLFLGGERDPRLKEAFRRLDSLNAKPVRLIMLALYETYDAGRITADEFASTCSVLESYLFRRSVMGRASAGLNRFFLALARRLLHEGEPARCVVATLLAQRKGTARFPEDVEFADELASRDLFNHFRFTKYCLESIEHLHQPAEPLGPLQVEHIMPQSIGGSPAWQAMLGDEWEQAHERFCHTLGNLTLTGYNQQYSNRPFQEKLDMPDHGLKASPLYLNASVRNRNTWDAAAIEERARLLVEDALKVWPRPSMPPAEIGRFVKVAEAEPRAHPRPGFDDPRLLAIAGECAELTDGVAPYAKLSHGFNAGRFGAQGIEKIDWLSQRLPGSDIYLVAYERGGIPLYYWRSQAPDGQVLCHARVLFELVSVPEDTDLSAVARRRHYYVAPVDEFRAEEVRAMVEDVACWLREAMVAAGATPPAEGDDFKLDLPEALQEQAGRQELSEWNQVQLAYWKRFHERALADREFMTLMRPQKAQPQHYMNIHVGSSKCHIELSIGMRDRWIGVAFYVGDDKALGRRAVDALSELEAMVGVQGRPIDAEKASGVRFNLDGCDVKGSVDRWPEFIRWHLRTAVKLRRALMALGIV